MDGALRRLGRSTDFEPSLGTRVAGGVLRPFGAPEVLGIPAGLVEPLLLTRVRTFGVKLPLARLEALCDVGKEDEDFLKVGVPRLPPVGELFARSSGPGAESEGFKDD
jgi:hypothetical protein